MQLSSYGKIEQTMPGSQKEKAEKGKGDAELDQSDFLNLLITQLQNQDPLNPMDSSDFTSQTTAFSQLEEMINMNKAMTAMLEMMTQQSGSNSALVNSAGFLGKQIEFTTNTVTVGGDSQPNISFYVPETPDASKSEIRVYNEDGDLVTIVRPESMKKGENVINWDGKGIGGTVVADGTYSFEVRAFGSDGKQLEVQEFGKGIVKGVKMVGGVLYFDIGDGVVSSEYVYSVTEAPKKEEPENPDEKPEDKPEDKPDEKPDEKSV